MKLIIRALSEKGLKVIKEHKKDTEKMRAKINNTPPFLRSKTMKDFLKIDESFTDSEHIINTPFNKRQQIDLCKYNIIHVIYKEGGREGLDFEIIEVEEDKFNEV